MTFEALAAPALDAADPIFDFSRSAAPPAPVAANQNAPLGADRPNPEHGWATRDPDKALLFLFLTPRDGHVVDELLSL
jgi:hypothetical protein